MKSLKLKDLPKSLAYNIRHLKRAKKRFSHRNRARDPKIYKEVKLDA